MFVMQLFANYNSRRLPSARKIYDLLERTFRINRNTARSGFQDAKVGHAPFRRIVANQHHAIAWLDTGAGKKPGGARCQLAHVSVGVLLLASVALDAHGDASRVALG